MTNIFVYTKTHILPFLRSHNCQASLWFLALHSWSYKFLICASYIGIWTCRGTRQAFSSQWLSKLLRASATLQNCCFQLYELELISPFKALSKCQVLKKLHGGVRGCAYGSVLFFNDHTGSIWTCWTPNSC